MKFWKLTVRFWQQTAAQTCLRQTPTCTHIISLHSHLHPSHSSTQPDLPLYISHVPWSTPESICFSKITQKPFNMVWGDLTILFFRSSRTMFAYIYIYIYIYICFHGIDMPFRPSPDRPNYHCTFPMYPGPVLFSYCYCYCYYRYYCYYYCYCYYCCYCYFFYYYYITSTPE